ncbi:MAG: hypothetical protein Q9182_007344 [Xanthomendoza sp. 2 TL-2023]
MKLIQLIPSILLLAHAACTSPLHPPWRPRQQQHQTLATTPSDFIEPANRSGNEFNPDTRPLPAFINSTHLPSALTKALQLNFPSAISRFHPNGSYKNMFELPDTEPSSSSRDDEGDSSGSEYQGCRWPRIGQRIEVQVFTYFVSGTSTSRLSFWVLDPVLGIFEHCISVVPPGWKLLKTFVMMPCLDSERGGNALKWELRAGKKWEDMDLVVREFSAVAEATVELNLICAPILDGTQCDQPQIQQFPITSVFYYRNFDVSTRTTLAPAGYRAIGKQTTGLTGLGR